MDSFKTHLTEQKNTKNLHMQHIEDQVIYGGVKGTRQAIFALRDMRDMLGGQKKGSVTVKWDGAPAVFAGTDPSDGKFFVAKKGIFNKNPKVYKTPADVDADTSGDLAVKLKEALQYLSKVGIKGVIQGDFLFSKADVKKQMIDGQEYVTFHPNTIIYAFPSDSKPAQDVLRAKMGIVWHTTYTGATFETMKASFGVNVKALKKTPDVFQQDAMLADVSKFAMKAKETKDINKSLIMAGKIFNQISGNVLRELESNRPFAQLIETFNNTHVRAGQPIKNTTKHVNLLIQWIKDRFQKEADKRSTNKGKNAQFAKRDEILKFFSPKNKMALKRIFDLQKIIVVAKLKLINTLNRFKRVKTFVKTINGFKVTGEEGYVAIDKLSGGAVKVVDRLEFSYNNFSKDIIKGWDKAR